MWDVGVKNSGHTVPFIECTHSHCRFDHHNGEVVCSRCGLVLGANVIHHQSRYSNSCVVRTTGPPQYLSHSNRLTATISSDKYDALGKKLSLSKLVEIRRLKRRQMHCAQRSGAKNLLKAMIEIHRLVDKIQVPGFVREEAAYIYRKAFRRGFPRGRSIVAIAASSVYAACRCSGVPRTLKEVSRVSPRSLKEIAQYYRLLVTELGLYVASPDPIRYVSRIAAAAEISSAAQDAAVKILRFAKRSHWVAGKDPPSMAATALYVACQRTGEKKTVPCIAEAAGVSEVTLRNHYKPLKKLLES